MDTAVLERNGSIYLINQAHIARSQEDVSADQAKAVGDWEIDKSSPFITWISGDFVEGDKPNQNTQMWTSGDLAMSEYSIKYAPLNMVHKFRTPIGFFAATKTVPLKREEASEESIKIQALSGLWSHIFQFETAQAEAANDAGLLFYSMECRGTHLTCAGPDGCGETFDYMATDTHCEHLMERSSIRHIVNPTFRGGALIVPPVKPGWKEAGAAILQESVMQEAAVFAEQNEAAYNTLTDDGVNINASAWETVMAMAMTAGR
jgi:hypothetical protein